MRKRRLNDTDFCKTTVLPEDQQVSKLMRMVSSYAPYSLNPVRSRFPDIFNLEAPLFAGMDHSHAKWEAILEGLLKSCRAGLEMEQNGLVALMLHEFALARVSLSRSLPYRSLRLGEDRPLWQPSYLVIDDKPVLFQVEPRGTDGFTGEARRVVFSAMNAGVRDVDTDFEDARLLIIQLPRTGDTRSLRLYWGDDVPLFSYGDLREMATRTESIWVAVQEEQERRRRGGSEATGTLL